MSTFGGGGNIVNDNLVFAIDTGANRSYTSLATTLYDIVGSVNPNVSTATPETDDIYYDSGSNVKASWPAALDVDDNTTPRTWEVVAKTVSVSSSIRGVFGHQVSSGCSYFCNGGIMMNGSKWVFNWYDNSAYRNIGSVIVIANQWYHIVATFETDRLPRIYINGVLDIAYTVTSNLNYSTGMNYYSIANKYASSPTQKLNGYVPIIRFYKGTALNAAQVKQNYDVYNNRFKF